MFVDREKAVAELKELKYKLGNYGAAYDKIAYFLKNDPSKASLEGLPTIEDVTRDLNKWKELSEKKDRFGKALGTKVSIE
jgi:RecJ-like exonuclease